tara:strand:+ start:99 stop:797 length:699 start_codon:yes stop_codon:yes gene_type:complete
MKETDLISIKKLKSWGLLNVIKRETIIDKLISTFPEPSLEDKQNQYKNWCLNLNIKSQEQLNNWQKEQGLSNEQWQEMVLRRNLWIKWCSESFKDEINSHYLKRKNQLDKVTYSLLRVKNQNLAMELYMRIKESETSFEDVVAEFSEGAERKVGGLLGPVPLSQPHPFLGKLLQISKPKQLWPPKQLDNWWIVVRLEEIHNTKLDDELKLRLSLELGDEYIKKSESETIKKI